jgi:Tfp pilus assembly protein PilF
LALLPSILHNAAAGQELVLATTNWGQIYFIGNNADNPTGRFQELPFVRSNPAYEQEDFKAEAERRAGRTMDHGQVSRFWLGQGLRWSTGNPGTWLGVQWSKLRLFGGGYETPASLDYYLYSRRAPLLRLQLPAFGLLGPLGLVGTLLAFRRRGWPRLLAVYTVGASLSIVGFFVLTRFRMVIVPALCVLAAFAVVEIGRAYRDGKRERRWTRAAALTALLIVCFVFVNFPVRATADRWSYRVASALSLPTDLETTANAHFNLGVTHAARDELIEAEAELRAAIAEGPQNKMRIELGKVLARQQRNDEAIEVYLDAARAEPNDYRIRHTLGLLHRRSGDTTAAEAAFREALGLEPRHTASAVRLGEVLLEQGRHREAADSFRHALRLNPQSRAADEGLARAEERR